MFSKNKNKKRQKLLVQAFNKKEVFAGYICHWNVPLIFEIISTVVSK